MASIILPIQVSSTTITLDVSQTPLPDVIFINSFGGGGSLTSNFEFDFNAPPPPGTVIDVICYGLAIISLNGFEYKIFGVSYPADVLATDTFTIRLTSTIDSSGSIVLGSLLIPNFLAASPIMYGDMIYDNSLNPTKLQGITSGKIIVGSATDVATAVAMSGDATIAPSGAITIGSGAVTDSKIATGITRAKLATGTANQVVINNGTGAMSSEAQLATSRGGTGQDFSASTGFLKSSSGTMSVGAITDSRSLTVSFETGLVGDFKVRMGFAGTITGMYCMLTKAIGAVDATIGMKNNAGTTMASVQFTASDPKGTALTAVATTNNTFVAGDILTFTTLGGSSAGQAMVSFDYTRTS